MTTIFTIGFTKTTAESFFNRLRTAGVTRVIDIRLNNISQLAGFAKKDDLKFFLKAICGIEYLHKPEFAPTPALLEAYKKKGGDWNDYEQQFLNLIKGREIEKVVTRELLDRACLLCSEDKPEHCHRRLVAEYLRSRWGDVKIEHL